MPIGAGAWELAHPVSAATAIVRLAAIFWFVFMTSPIFQVVNPQCQWTRNEHAAAPRVGSRRYPAEDDSASTVRGLQKSFALFR
jgi:hypothetical protein